MAIIGIMDSGVGGLSVYREIRKILPGERYIYHSDNAFCPYGEKEPAFIRERCAHVTRMMLQKGADVIVLACNTATSAAVQSLRSSFSAPFIGMEPAVKPAVLSTQTGVVGVLATAGTLRGLKYLGTKERWEGDVRVLEQVGQGFVELVESGDLTGPHAEDVVRRSLQPLLDAGSDRIALGCTHYPFLLDSLKKVAGPGVQFIDPAPAVAAHLVEVLKDNRIALCSPPVEGETVELISSGDPAPLRRMFASL